MLKNCTEEQIKLYAKQDTVRMKDMDAYIGIRGNSNSAELNHLPEQSMKWYNQYYTVQVHFEERVKHTKWCILRYPNTSIAQMSNLSTEEFEDLYYKVCTLDYAKMEKAMEPLKVLMDKTDKVHIIGEGTDLPLKQILQYILLLHLYLKSHLILLFYWKSLLQFSHFETQIEFD